MVQRLLILAILGLSFSGCTIIAKSQTRMIKPAPLESKEQVWVEAVTKKVWVNQHVDENGDLVEGHYKHIVLTPGHWVTKENDRKK